MAQKPNVLLAVGPLLQREVDLDELLEQLVDQIAQALAADRGTLYLVDPEAGELFSQGGAPARAQADPAEARAGHRRHRRRDRADASTCRSAEGDRRFFREIDRQTGYRTRSVLAAPLRDRDGNVIGVVQVLNAKRGSFSAADEEYLKRLAAEAALAVENTSLYALVRPRRRATRSAPAACATATTGSSASRRRCSAVYALTRKAAATDATVLLRGESGTGKELIARAIHYNSAAARRAVREGRLRDAPADADGERAVRPRARRLHRRRGARARQVRGGRTAARCSSTRSASCRCRCRPSCCASCRTASSSASAARARSSADVRVVAATHRDLEAMVGRGQFREDLYYRIKVVQMLLPPLRERGAEDMMRLAEHFLDVYGASTASRCSVSAQRRATRLVAASLARQHPRARELHRERGGAVRGQRDRRRAPGAAARPRRGAADPRRIPPAPARRRRARPHPARPSPPSTATAPAPPSYWASAATRSSASSRSTARPRRWRGGRRCQRGARARRRATARRGRRGCCRAGRAAARRR